mmetsp:Transcript_32368/g.48838  ORF Transcript_32368/g.48838 Transcript_32368/m.48838 type:complete len:114 (-) Transcript_32368:27-368(-)
MAAVAACGCCLPGGPMWRTGSRFLTLLLVISCLFPAATAAGGKARGWAENEDTQRERWRLNPEDMTKSELTGWFVVAAFLFVLSWAGIVLFAWAVMEWKSRRDRNPKKKNKAA